MKKEDGLPMILGEGLGRSGDVWLSPNGSPKFEGWSFYFWQKKKKNNLGYLLRRSFHNTWIWGPPSGALVVEFRLRYRGPREKRGRPMNGLEPIKSVTTQTDDNRGF